MKSQLQQHILNQKQQISLNNSKESVNNSSNINTNNISKQKNNLHDMNNQKMAQQKLKVSILSKKSKENPEAQQISNQFSEINSSIGPFSQLKQNQKNYSELDISPILALPSQRKAKINITNKKTKNILTQQSLHDNNNKIDQSELQKQILDLAKSIRLRVNKKSSAKAEPLQNQVINRQHSPILLKNKQVDLKLKKIFQKRQSLFQKYSYPRTNGINLSQLEKQEENLKNAKVGKYNTSRIYNQEDIQESIQNISQQIHSQAIAKRSSSRTQDSHKVRKQSLLPKLKLSFDLTHHKYKITEFRKSILRQKKQRQAAKQMQIKQKEQTLQKRRQIYNNSRYHPVGIKLNSLKGSKLQRESSLDTKNNLNESIAQVDLNTKIDLQLKDKIDNQQIEKQQIAIKQQDSIPKQQSLEKPQLFSQYMNQKVNNTSQVKSSLTFNFSFSDTQNNRPFELKTQSQVYNEIDNLTKQMQNDSSPKQKIEKIEKIEKASLNNQNTQSKKWSSIEKQSTNSKNLDQVEGLHNSSRQGEGQDSALKDTSLEYSYF